MSDNDKTILTPFYEVTEHTLSLICNSIKVYLKGFRKRRIPKSNRRTFNVPISFDTETTNYINTKTDEKIGWLYMWMFRFGNPDDPDSIAVYGRDLFIFDRFLNELHTVLELSTMDQDNLILIVYIHNLGFDFEFIREKLVIIDSLHSDTHNPIFVRDVRGFEFRDSKILAGGLSLQKIGESLETQHKKMVGDLDYNLIRTPETPLTDTELMYCLKDVDVLSAYIQTQIKQYSGVEHIPLTNTGRVRAYARNKIYNKSSYDSFKRYRGLMDECVLTPDQYEYCKKAFYGGYTHANINHVGKTLYNVKSYDFTSSYPAVMLSERYPMGKPESIETMSFKDYTEIVNDIYKCSIATVQLSNVFIKDTVFDHYISNDHDKVMVVKPCVDNGRIISAEKISMTITDVDFKIINQVYDYDKIHISNILVWKTEHLPTQLLEIIIDLYKSKTELKGVPERIEEYNIKKGMLNSLYGMCVTGILRDKITVGCDGWKRIPLTDDEKIENIEKNNNSRTRFLYYPWGVFITSYARFNLWTAIKSLGNDYIYSDTDSIKVFADSEKLDEYLKKYHQDLTKKFEWMCEHRRKFKPSDLSPKTIDGIIKPLGVWEYEGSYPYFKTLGSKRYMKYDGKKLSPTVSGIRPSNLAQWLIEKSDGDILKAFNLFDNGLHVPDERTGKLASCYYDHVDLDVIDYLGNKTRIRQDHGVHLYPVEFTLTMTESYLDLIKKISEVF